MTIRALTRFAALICASLLAACGGGGGSGGGGRGDQPQSIAFANQGPLTGAVGTSVTNTAAGGAGSGAVTYVSGNSAIATVDASSGVATLVGVGDTTITATKAASSGFLAAAATYSLTVTPAPQTIAFANAGPLTGMVGTSVTNTASGGAGTGAITYVSGNSAIATVDSSSGVATLVGAGNTTITATKAASSGFLAATATYSLIVTTVPPEPQTIAFAQSGPLTGVVGTTITNTASGGAGTGAITYVSGNTAVVTVDASSGVATLVGAGNTTITANKAASGGYLSATATYALTVTPATQTISFALSGPINVVLDATSANTASGGNGSGAITYASSNPSAASVNATTGVTTATGIGSATITATKAADANYQQAQASYAINVQSAGNVSAFIGATGTQVHLPASANGKQFARARISDCVDASNILTCANVEQGTAGFAPVNDTRATLATPAYYAILNGSTQGAAVEVGAARFSGRIGHVALYFKNRYWVIGGGEPILPGSGTPVQHQAKADVWSSADGRTWKLETSDAGFGARWFHHGVVFNNRIWIFTGSAIPPQSPLPWYSDAWSSADGITWQLESANLNLPWWSTALNVVVFNNEIFAVSGGRVYSYSNGLFVQKPGSGTPALTGTTLGRTWATLTVYNNQLWFIGGKVDYPINQPPGGDAMNDVWRSADGVNWTQMIANGAAPFAARYRHIAYVANGRLWILGGQAATAGVAGPITPDAWSTTDGVTWQKENANSIARTYLMQSVQENGRVTAVGGIQEGYANLVWQTINGLDWSQRTPHAQFSPRSSHGVSFNGQMWLIAGYAVDGTASGRDSNEIWRSGDGVNWSRVTPSGAIFSPRNGARCVVFNNRLWVIGGWSDTTGPTPALTRYNDVWSSADGVTWRQETAAAPFSARVGHAVVAFNGRIWVLGGSTDTGDTNDVWSSADGLTWTQATGSAAFSARRSPGLVVLNNEMLLAGGGGATGLNDMWRSTDGITWTPVIPSGTHFSPRTRHSMTVFNNRAYVVGGVSDENYSTGTRFNDVWSSSDGINWRQETASASFEQRSLAVFLSHNNELWVIAGFGIQHLNDAWRSSDGVNWRVGFSHDIASP